MDFFEETNIILEVATCNKNEYELRYELTVKPAYNVFTGEFCFYLF